MKFASSTGRTAIARTVRSRSGLNPSMTSPVNRFSATFSSVHPLSQFDCVVSFGLFNPEYGFKKYLLYSRQAAGRGCSPLTPKKVTRASDPVKLNLNESTLRFLDARTMLAASISIIFYVLPRSSSRFLPYRKAIPTPRVMNPTGGISKTSTPRLMARWPSLRSEERRVGTEWRTGMSTAGYIVHREHE